MMKLRIYAADGEAIQVVHPELGHVALISATERGIVIVGEDPKRKLVAVDISETDPVGGGDDPKLEVIIV